jgi:hypothetical protein
MNDGETYLAPAHGWTCFHCGETFKTVGGARDHFGADPGKVPGCMLKVALGPERGLLMALRRVEEELATLYRERADEDAPLHRAIAGLQSRHSDALQSAEELGYARGLSARFKVTDESLLELFARIGGARVELTDGRRQWYVDGAALPSSIVLDFARAAIEASTGIDQ